MHTSKLFTRTQAEDLAAVLNADPEEDWIYTPVHDPKGTGYSFINIVDESGTVIGKL